MSKELNHLAAILHVYAGGCLRFLYIFDQSGLLCGGRFDNLGMHIFIAKSGVPRVSVQGVKSLGGHFACLCRGLEFYEVKKEKVLLFFKKKWKYFYTLNHFYSEKSSKRAK